MIHHVRQKSPIPQIVSAKTFTSSFRVYLPTHESYDAWSRGLRIPLSRVRANVSVYPNLSSAVLDRLKGHRRHGQPNRFPLLIARRPPPVRMMEPGQ
jgi:hypothetical protein